MKTETRKNILENAPDGATHLSTEGLYLKYDINKVLYLYHVNYKCWKYASSWILVDHNLSDLRELQEKDQENEKLLVESKESVATTLLNAMEVAKVENFMCDVFSTDRDDGKSIEITCRYLDGKSTNEVITEMQARIVELENKIKGSAYLHMAAQMMIYLIEGQEITGSDWDYINDSQYEECEKAMAKRDLTQQAKGVSDFKEWVYKTDKNKSGLDVRDIDLADLYIENLINQAKGLK
jgi:hypothetical protein